MNRTKIEIATSSSSGTRKCLVCEEFIRDRTIIIDFTTHDGEDFVDRATNNLIMHASCAASLFQVMSTITRF